MTSSKPPRSDQRQALRAAELSDAEIELIGAAEVPEAERYGLEDVGRRPQLVRHAAAAVSRRDPRA